MSSAKCRCIRLRGSFLGFLWWLLGLLFLGGEWEGESGRERREFWFLQGDQDKTAIAMTGKGMRFYPGLPLPVKAGTTGSQALGAYWL